MSQPVIHDAEGPGFKPVNAVAAVAPFFDQAGAPQQGEMLGNRGARNRKGLRDAAGRKAALAQPIEYGAARGIGERTENHLCCICNRTATHNA